MRRCIMLFPRYLTEFFFFTFQVTYMLEGSFRHEDFCGHKGVINPGDLQVPNLKPFLTLNMLTT
jgi:hypothetical protein